jgi:cytochrome P450
VQEKGRKEIAAIAASHGVEDFKSYVPVYEDLNKMKYIENIVKEAMRLYPFPPALLRENSKDVELGGYHIPAGVIFNEHSLY